MTDHADLIDDMMAQIVAVTPGGDLMAALSHMIGSAAGRMAREIGRAETVSTLARLCIAINEGEMPEPPRRN